MVRRRGALKQQRSTVTSSSATMLHACCCSHLHPRDSDPRPHRPTCSQHSIQDVPLPLRWCRGPRPRPSPGGWAQALCWPLAPVSKQAHEARKCPTEVAELHVYKHPYCGQPPLPSGRRAHPVDGRPADHAEHEQLRAAPEPGDEHNNLPGPQTCGCGVTAHNHRHGVAGWEGLVTVSLALTFPAHAACIFGLRRRNTRSHRPPP